MLITNYLHTDPNTGYLQLVRLIQGNQQNPTHCSIGFMVDYRLMHKKGLSAYPWGWVFDGENKIAHRFQSIEKANEAVVVLSPFYRKKGGSIQFVTYERIICMSDWKNRQKRVHA